MRGKVLTILTGVGIAALALMWVLSDRGSNRLQPHDQSEGIEAPETHASMEETANGSSSLESEHEAGGRLEIRPELSIRLLDPDGGPVEGKVLLLERTPSLEQRLESGRWGASYLYEGALWEEAKALEGNCSLSLPKGVLQGDLLLLALAPGFAPSAVAVAPGVERQEIYLTSVEAIQVRVIDYEGRPVVGATCRLSPMYFDWADGPDSFEERLSLRAFIQESLTDSSGLVRFPISYPGVRNSIQVEPAYPLAIGSQSYCSPGQEVLIQCSKGFAVKGRFLDAETQEPIPNAALIYAKDTIEGTSTVKSGATDFQGVYGEESLPSDVPALSVIALLEGYAMERHRIVSPEPGRLYEHDFHFHRAHGLALKLSTSWGHPIADSQVRLRSGRNNFETSFFETDVDGVVHIPPVLREGIGYEVLVHVESQFWVLPDDVVHSGEEALIVPGLAQIQKVTLKNSEGETDEPISFDWTSMAAEHQGMVPWLPGTPSPLLASGSGTFGVVFKGGNRLEMTAFLPEGVQESFEFECMPATLSFAWNGAEDAVFSIRSSAAWDWHILESPLPLGAQELDLWRGRFHLIVEWDGGSLELPAITLDTDGHDLGTLGWQDTSEVRGYVVDGDGTPLEGVDVSLYSMDQGLGNFTYSEADGSFAIGGLSPGSYSLTATGGAVLGGQYSEENREVFLAPGEVLSGIDLELETQQDRLLRGSLGENPPAGTSAFIIESGRMHDVDLIPPMAFQLPIPESPALVGAGQLQQGLLYLVMEEVDAGVTSVEVPIANLSRTLKILDEFGAPWLDVRVHAFVGGAPLDFYALPDHQGEIRLKVSSQAIANLQLRFPDGRVQVVSLEEAMTAGRVVTPRIGDYSLVTVLDKSGRPIAGAVAMQYGVGAVVRGGGEGILRLPETGSGTPFLVSATGYLGVWDFGNRTHEIVLPLLVGEVALNISSLPSGMGELPPGSRAELLFPDLPPNSVDLSGMTVELLTGVQPLPPIPEGRVEVSIVSSADEVLITESFVILGEGQVLRFGD